jgi:hypothetical protein
MDLRTTVVRVFAGKMTFSIPSSGAVVEQKIGTSKLVYL